MKKLLILVACIIAMHAASAQVSMIKKQNHHTSNRETIIRSYGGTGIVACTNTDTTNTAYFIYSGGILQTTEYALKDYYINDIACENDTVFFCGKTISNRSRAIIGFFKMSDAFINGGNNKVYIQDTIYAGENKQLVSNLTRLVAYTGSDRVTRHVVCIGTCQDNYPCVIDFKPSSATNYNGGYINNPRESFCDIKMVKESNGTVVKNYLATAGFETTYGKYINLRLYDIDNVITNPGIQDLLYTFTTDPSNQHEWYTDGVLLTPLSDNNIATVSYRNLDVDTTTNFADINVSVYDVHRIATGNLYSMVHNLEIEMSDNEYHRTLHHAIYKSTTQTLAFLHTLEIPVTGFKASLFYEIDYTNITNPSAPRIYSRLDQMMQGLDNYNGTSQYVMSGFTISDPSILRYEFETFSLTPICPRNLDYESVSRPLVYAEGDHKPFNSSGFLSNLKKEGSEYRKFPILIECGE